jgi:TPR repeat protein
MKHILGPKKEPDTIDSPASNLYHEALKYKKNKDYENYLISLILSADQNYDPAIICFEMELTKMKLLYQSIMNICEKNHRSGTFSCLYLGFMCYNDKHYKNAYNYFQMAAIKGNAIAINLLGLMYRLGNYVKQDYVKAYEFYLLAANKGSICALHNLGVMYSCGFYVHEDYLKAIELYQIAFEKLNTTHSLDGIIRIYAIIGDKYKKQAISYFIKINQAEKLKDIYGYDDYIIDLLKEKKLNF